MSAPHVSFALMDQATQSLSPSEMNVFWNEAFREPHLFMFFLSQGHLNPALPVRSSVSEDGALAVCGSEDGMIHVWDARPDAEAPGGRECALQALTA